MFSIPDLLDRAKRGAGVDSDYALAKLLGHKRQANVSNWRLGKAVPEAASLIDLCKLSGDDAAEVIIMVQAGSAANDEEASVWNSIHARLQGGYIELGVLGALIALCLAIEGGWVQLGSSALALAVAESVYYVKYVLGVWFVWRLASLRYRCKSQLVTEGATADIVSRETQ